jgi:hypothetical protein
MEADIDHRKYHDKVRTEEVQDIIERMPTKFGQRVAIIVFFLFVLMLIFGWIIRYPDIVSGQITINANIAPIKLVANTSGILRLKGFKSQDSIKQGEVIAYIQNATSFDTLELIRGLVKDYTPTDEGNLNILSKLPSKVALGELTTKYYSFLNALHQLQNFSLDKLYDKQLISLSGILTQQEKEVINTNEKIQLSQNNLNYTYKLYKRDSILWREKVIAEAELDQYQLNYLNSRTNYQNTYSALIDAQKQVRQTQEQINEVNIQKSEKKKEIDLSITSTFNDLKDNILLWEQKYVFKAPFNGRLQFLKFWTDGQFVLSGDPIFTVVPNQGTPQGQVILPSLGSGKVKVGQEVIVKLDIYPYNEYGSIKGKVAEISLTTNTEKTQQGSIETYLVTITFDKGLMTNYGKKLDFNQESKGTADIITKDRKLIQRLFDNLRYEVKK